MIDVDAIKIRKSKYKEYKTQLLKLNAEIDSVNHRIRSLNSSIEDDMKRNSGVWHQSDMVSELKERLQEIKVLKEEKEHINSEIRKFPATEIIAFDYIEVFANGEYEKITTDVLIKIFNVKLKDVNDRTGVFENIMTFENFINHDGFLEFCNNVKEIVLNYNIKYSTIEDDPNITFLFPYSSGMYGGRWIDNEYSMIESLIKELIRQGYSTNVKETEHTIRVTVTRE